MIRKGRQQNKKKRIKIPRLNNSRQIITKRKKSNLPLKGRCMYLYGRREHLADSKIYDIRKWSGVLTGMPVFVLGNAPGIDIDNLDLLNGFFTIGINRIFLIYKPTILMWQDMEFWKDCWRKIILLDSIKVSRNISDPESVAVNFMLMQGDPLVSMKPWKLHGHGNTGMLAVQLALALGCSPIILLGMDCKYSKKRTDFYGKNKYHKKNTLRSCNRALSWMMKENFDIINCSYNDFWPRENLNNVVDQFGSFKYGNEYYHNILRSSKHKNYDKKR